MKLRISTILSIACISISFIYLFWIIIQNKHLYTEQFNYSKYKKSFEQSQWRVPQSNNPISDETLYTYAGYEYLQGISPVLINPEAPPFGKILIGLSITLFNNQRIGAVVIAFISLALIFFIVKIITQSFLASSIACLLTALNTLFIDQMIHAPQLEIFQLFFLLLFILLFLIYDKKKKLKYLIFSGIVFGLFLSIKVFFLHLILMNFSLIIFYILAKRNFKKFVYEIIILNSIALSIFTATYYSYFLPGNSFRSFLGAQKWIYEFYRNSSIDSSKLLGSYLSLIFFNKWRFWTTGYPLIQYSSWSFLWMIIFLFGNISAVLLFRIKKIKPQILFIISFLITYNIFLFFIPIFPRYLLLLFIPYSILIPIYIVGYFERKK